MALGHCLGFVGRACSLTDLGWKLFEFVESERKHDMWQKLLQIFGSEERGAGTGRCAMPAASAVGFT